MRPFILYWCWNLYTTRNRGSCCALHATRLRDTNTMTDTGPAMTAFFKPALQKDLPLRLPLIDLFTTYRNSNSKIERQTNDSISEHIELTHHFPI